MTQHYPSRNVKSILGVAFAAIGLLLLFVNLDDAASGFSRSLASPAESLGTAFELSLAGLRAAQDYFFDHSKFQSGVYQILLSCWPLTLVFFGAALLQNAVGSRWVRSKAGVPSRKTQLRPGELCEPRAEFRRQKA